jgi:hypothetical protein
MPEQDWIRIAAAYAQSVNRCADDCRNLWKYGRTQYPLDAINVEFCAADFCVEVSL